MKELIKVERRFLNNVYEGIRNDGATIICILDDNCVRYTVRKKGSNPYKNPDYRKYFSNDEKEKCFKLATRALNK